MYLKIDRKKLALAHMCVVLGLDNIEILKCLSIEGKNELLQLCDSLNRTLQQQS